MKEKIVALYERLSRDDEQLGESNSIVNQKKLLAEYAERNGYTNYQHYTDDGWSGTNFERPDWQRLVADIDKGIVSTVIVKDLSRIGRDYLQVGFYTDVYFRQKHIHFVAITNGVDSNNSDTSEFAPFLNIMNEWYVRDTSRKIKTAYKTKGNSGVAHLSRPCYGYMKDPDNENKWIIDPEAAIVVRRIFDLCMEGYSQTQIAYRLSKEKIERPSYYLGTRKRGLYNNSYNVEDRYNWRQNTVGTILRRQEYYGCTVNFRTNKESYKDKRTSKNDPENWVVFENTQEPIVSKETWEICQKWVNSRSRKRTEYKECPALTGKVFCGTCGTKMSKRIFTKDRVCKDYHRAGVYRKRLQKNIYRCAFPSKGYYHKSKACNANQIRMDELDEIVLETIRRTCDFAIENEEEFRKLIADEDFIEKKNDKKAIDKKIKESVNRQGVINTMIKKLYEDYAKGKISESFFDETVEELQKELSDLEVFLSKANAEMDNIKSVDDNIEYFMNIARKYTDLKELTPLIASEFIDKVVVHKAVGTGILRTQEVDIYLNYIGTIQLPAEPEPEKTEEEILAEKKAFERYLKHKEANRKYAEKRRKEIKKEWDAIENDSNFVRPESVDDIPDYIERMKETNIPIEYEKKKQVIEDRKKWNKKAN